MTRLKTAADLLNRRRSRALGLSLVASLAWGCAHRVRTSVPNVDRRDLAVYRVVADSLYLTKAQGRPIAVVNRTLDTACAQPACASIEKRWGLDSLWWAGDNAALARQIRDILIVRAGTPLGWENGATVGARVVLVEPTAVPAAAADSAAWKNFQESFGVAALQFSPVGFSPDGSRALVVVRMRCGPRCGHLLAAGLVSKGDHWTVGELLLVMSGG